MNNEPFHILSQDWRYFPRQKELIATLHLGQLPEARSGDTVLILPTPATGTSTLRGYGVPPITLPPINPYKGIDWTKSVLNFPPLWGNLAGFALSSGSYGVTGTFRNFVPIQTLGNYAWAATGGTFLVMGSLAHTENNAGEMDGGRTKLFTSAVDGVVSNVIQDTQWVIRMMGDGWNNQQYVSEFGAIISNTSLIVQDVPTFTSVGAYAEQSSIDGKGTAVSGLGTLVLRLGSL